jgi:hypothetical protein
MAARFGRAGEIAVDLDAFRSGERQLLRGDPRGVGNSSGNTIGTWLDLDVCHLACDLLLGYRIARG